jgi:hypothetical protein
MRSILSALTLGTAVLVAACAGNSPGNPPGDDDQTGDDDGTNPPDPTGDAGGDPQDHPDAGNVPEGPPDEPIDFANNLFASPAPPGQLKPSEAPQIIVFGWDDCAFTGDDPRDSSANDNGMNFVARTFGGLAANPNGSKASVSFYQNGAYLPNSEQGGPWGSETNLMLAAGQELLAKGFEVGNHTFDHLETNGTWGKIPAAFRMGSGGGWTEAVGTILDEATWHNLVIKFNGDFLKQTYGLSENLHGFRAPRLEINDKGLQAMKALGYEYDANMEEGMQESYVTAITKAGADTRGFNWVVWPYTLDNGSPGAWQSQDFDEKHYLKDFPAGLWEVPVYMAYLPDDGLQQTIATRMKHEITMEDTSWIGDRVREITAFDFNTFLYARLKKDEWVKMMKWTFLTRYHGNRAPITFGAHPEEYSSRYDNEVLHQANNTDFLDVLSYTTYAQRKAAVKEFVNWVKQNYASDVYFMSGKQLVQFMKTPFDKHGTAVPADELASPAANDFFRRYPEWQVDKDELGSDATIHLEDRNTMTIDFKVGRKNEAMEQYPFVDVATMFPAGSLSGVSHIDIVYETSAPFRIRLLTDEVSASAPLPMQVLLAGVGGERVARIRIKDFSPDPYADPEKVGSAGLVDNAYLGKVLGLAFESASTKDNTSFTVKIKQIHFHGLSGASGKVSFVQKPTRVRTHRPRSTAGSSVKWPAHREL